MNAMALLEKYLGDNPPLFHLVCDHSKRVVEKALWIADKHPELNLNRLFLEEAGMIHDIGVFLTHAPSIHCFGTRPYLCHGFLGRELMEKEGYFSHALVCERHTGTGLSVEEIQSRELPLPHRDMLPVTPEEQVLCFSDTFFSKSKPQQTLTVDEALASVARFGEKNSLQFTDWCHLFL